ncbi:phosphoenolpyruvate synthase/pyruvate phosphate dikinase [Methylocaldum marinum]|uniref:Phosphoenolpyruvate synthase n=1 Tax=Methylocaldum marinum TaxID=1432792 RepID=A0A250KYK7_9GAMM|nr:phosphoenolpyruvate synthase [Methylocaldum marinum]BBA36672.1 phosphoenolpyruvate synthase/pyruvate phosphate dikinase [Methylocaldum marinum]
MNEYVVWFEALGIDDVGRVGGKNASLGEMISQLSEAGVTVPDGFATTAEAYRDFLAQKGLDQRIWAELDRLDVDNVTALARAGETIRQWILNTPFTPGLEKAITEAYERLAGLSPKEFSVAVRSSATAEDLPTASFAGQQETYLNVHGLEGVLRAVKQVFASLFNDRAIAYRVHQGFEHRKVLLSAGVQRMVRSDLAASGVIFTLDTESGFRDAVFVTSSYGLGEMVVQGAVDPDEFYVYKPSLASGKSAVLRRSIGKKAVKMIYDPVKSVITIDTPEADRQRFSITDREAEELARLSVRIEQHYQRPMDIEWAKDGLDGKLYILQARPETVQSRVKREMERYRLTQKGKVLAQGRSVGHRIGKGCAKVIASVSQMDLVQPGDVLVTDMTDPDWEPIMKRASAIVTNRGGRTCHAAIIARELGIPAVVGCGDATRKIQRDTMVTVSCAEGDAGYIYQGELPYEVSKVNLDEMPKLPVKLMLNVANPERAFAFSALPNDGVGLARLEFVIARTIGVHPKALLEYERQSTELQQAILERMAGYADPVSFYVDKLAEGIAMIAAAFAPKPVIVRTSDFKTNEYANLLGGEAYEPREENPMIGFRGASRYVDESFRDCFELECRALKKVREEMGLENVWVMIPFVRTLEEARGVAELLQRFGLPRGVNGLKWIMMCEIPSNPLLADEFLQIFDGFSIGSNDLTQLALGIDRDSGLVAGGFDERNPAVKALIGQAIQACRRHGKYIGICGQGPSDHPDLARWLLDEGIESLSLNPDTVVETWMFLAGKDVG